MNNHAIKLIWPDGVTAIPLRNLSKEEAEEYVRDLQPQYDREGNGTRITVTTLV
jgi:hypothetical protein